MEEVDLEVALKILIVGNGMVGKTTLLNKYLHNEFGPKYQRTIGSDFKEKMFTLKSGQELTLLLWDMAGQEQYSALTKSYYKGASAVVYVFSSTDRASFQAVQKWVDGARAELSSNVVEVLVQTKADLISDYQVTDDDATRLATSLQLPLFKISAKVDDMNPLFAFLSTRCAEMNTRNEGAITTLEQHSKPTSEAVMNNSSQSLRNVNTPRKDRQQIQSNSFDEENIQTGNNDEINHIPNQSSNQDHEGALTKRAKKKSKCVIM